METFQCPDCELKFRFSSELEQHLSLEHPDFKAEDKTVEDSLIHATHRHRHKRRDLKGD
jgi:hypothetical protein